MNARPYDVIVIGTREAGTTTAMLLARRGLRVLAVDHARFPSDALSSHQIQVPGIARRRRWGLLDAIEASGAPATTMVRFDPGPVSMEGRLLDALLIDAFRFLVQSSESSLSFRYSGWPWRRLLEPHRTEGAGTAHWSSCGYRRRASHSAQKA
jgi:2-polyprenyl-6-methoxyphenol hydroxylase-like FAD-dependent oxidoreductase